jgi:hypothetical protein
LINFRGKTKKTKKEKKKPKTKKQKHQKKKERKERENPPWKICHVIYVYTARFTWSDPNEVLDIKENGFQVFYLPQGYLHSVVDIWETYQLFVGRHSFQDGILHEKKKNRKKKPPKKEENKTKERKCQVDNMKG